MTVRARLTAAFALFAALPVAAAFWPVSRALSRALEQEYAERLDQAARAVESEYRAVAAEALAACRELARGPELEDLSRGREPAALDAAEAAGRAAGWMRARGLDVLAVVAEDGVVVTSGHLPARAGEADPDLRALFEAVPAGVAAPRTVAVAGPEGLEPALAAVAWERVPGTEPPLRVAAGVALGPRFAARLAALTGGEVTVRAPGSGRGGIGAAPTLSGRLLGALRERTREVAVPSAEAPGAEVSVTLPASGLARAQRDAVAALAVALAVAVAAAALLGHALARRITRPLEELRAGAVRVASGELSTRVEVPATGEVRQVVDAFNRMTSDLAETTARAAAAERVAAWREVARRLAHEVRNPLTPVAMSVETLREAWSRRSPAFPEIFDEATLAIGEEVRRLARIVDEFGRFARLPAPSPRQVAPAELVDAILALYGDGDGAVRVERAVEPDLPPVRVDPDQIGQVLHNLVANALQAVGARGTVRVAARREGGELELAVSDDGPGVPPEHLARLFEPYFTTKAGGTGLGLAISERIVREHGGRVEVRSAPGAGATFAVRLPLVTTAPGSP